MASILHVIEFLSRGGGMRAMCGIAKYSHQFEGHQHSLLSLNPALDDPNAKELAKLAGLNLLSWNNEQELDCLLSNADIVQLNWWNSPTIGNFLRKKLPECRLITWLHVGGNSSPHIVTPELLRIADITVPCSPYTARCKAISQLPDSVRLSQVRMAYGAADFARVANVPKTPHSTFNVGYIGTVHFLKMHPDYVAMSAAAEVPNAKFIICGSGGAEQKIAQQAYEVGRSRDFDVRGYVDDIAAAISEFDIYGYPLCPDTYAAAEVNLQEVMYAGIPAVVFPYGGLRDLVINNYTGLIVDSPAEYAQAIEFLYYNPAERQRIGTNAANYARQIFGAENAARVFNNCYKELLKTPKRQRLWGVGVVGELTKQQVLVSDCHPIPQQTPHQVFLESLWEESGLFTESLLAEAPDFGMSAEDRFKALPEVLKSGLRSYAIAFPGDRYLQMWYGLSVIESAPNEALPCLVNAANLGIDHWRIIWYIAVAAKNANNLELAKNAATKVLELNPQFLPAIPIARREGGRPVSA